MSDTLARIQLIQLEVDRVHGEAQAAASAGDLDRLTALRQEMEVLLNSMREIRREQLMEQIDPPRPERRRHWWTVWR